MAKVSAIHSEKQAVHHDNNKCTEGNNIEAVNRKAASSSATIARIWLRKVNNN